MATIGVITTCGTYDQFIPEWAQSVKQLNRRPDKVVIAAQNPSIVGAHLAQERLDSIVIRVDEPFQFGTYLNRAIEACDTDWIVWIGADDRYRPTALDGIDNIDEDVFVFGMRLSGSACWMGDDINGSLLHNPVPCGSPFKRWIWEILPFQPDLAPFEDWAFWAGAHMLGAQSRRSNRIDFDYTIHPGQTHPANEPWATYVKEWAVSLVDVDADPT